MSMFLNHNCSATAKQVLN